MLFSFEECIIDMQIMCVTLKESDDVIRSEYRCHISNCQNTNILWVTYLLVRDLSPYSVQQFIICQHRNEK